MNDNVQPGVPASGIPDNQSDDHSADCDYCEQPVDLNGYEYRLVGQGDLVLCSVCEESGRHL